MRQASQAGLQAVGYNILVKPDPLPDRIGSIFVPANHRDIGYRNSRNDMALIVATVESVGAGRMLDNGKIVEPLVQKGDRVRIGSHDARQTVDRDGVELLSIPEGDLLTKVLPDGDAPLGGRVLIRRKKPSDRTEGGIVLPDSAKEKLNEGRVVVLGTGRILPSGVNAGFGCRVGDDVIFGGAAIDIGELTLVFEENILCIVRR